MKSAEGGYKRRSRWWIIYKINQQGDDCGGVGNIVLGCIDKNASWR